MSCTTGTDVLQDLVERRVRLTDVVDDHWLVVNDPVGRRLRQAYRRARLGDVVDDENPKTDFEDRVQMCLNGRKWAYLRSQ